MCVVSSRARREHCGLGSWGHLVGALVLFFALALDMGCGSSMGADGRPARAATGGVTIVVPERGIEPPSTPADSVRAFGDDARSEGLFVPTPAAREAGRIARDEDVVAAGTSFTVRLNDSLGTSVSQPGDEFSGVVLTPLYGQTGHLVVPAGALVFGRVSEIRQTPNTGLCLQLLTIETKGLPASLHATIRKAGPRAFIDSVETYNPNRGYDALVLPSRDDRAIASLGPAPAAITETTHQGPAQGGLLGVGGGPPLHDGADLHSSPTGAAATQGGHAGASSDRVFLPEGTELLLELARPLVGAFGP